MGRLRATVAQYNHRGYLMKLGFTGCGIGWLLLAACSPQAADNAADPIEPQRTRLSDGAYHKPPPPSPPPPPPAAVCGDMNGGGDQHVDFAALMATKTAEKADVMQTQAALLEQRYDLADNPSPTCW
jgi:hypothetical protein